jgi:hypothetical protein
MDYPEWEIDVPDEPDFEDEDIDYEYDETGPIYFYE